MERIPFSQRLKNAKVDIRREYERLYSLFYLLKIPYGSIGNITLKETCANSFPNFPIRDTCISLDDFNDTHGFNFEDSPIDFNIDYLVSFCEYTYNLVSYSERYNSGMITLDLNDAITFYIHQIMLVIGKIGYMGHVKDNLMIIVPKDQVVISVAEIVDPNLSYRLIEYNHHSMKGNLEKKRAILLVLADQLEPLQTKLKEINSKLAKDVFFLLNNVNVRHNNIDQNGTNYNPYVANMKKEEFEQWYDTIYQLCLLAFLELEHLDRKERIDQLKQNIHQKES